MFVIGFVCVSVWWTYACHWVCLFVCLVDLCLLLGLSVCWLVDLCVSLGMSVCLFGELMFVFGLVCLLIVGLVFVNGWVIWNKQS